MSKLYKQTKILVSRFYYHGGDGLENLGLQFFRSQEHYEEEAQKNGWTEAESFKRSWCTKPVEMEALIGQKDLVLFEHGHSLSPGKVFFAGDMTSKVHRIGSWQ